MKRSTSFAVPQGAFLRGYQLRALKTLLRGIKNCPGETFTVMFPRQAGKNEVSAALVALLLQGNATLGGSIVVCAPTLSPQAQISFDRTRALLCQRLVEKVAPLRFDGETIRLGLASATYLSASPEAHVAGHTASLALIADEAQDIDADWFNRQFRPMAASTGAPTVMFGTPWTGHTLLEEQVARNRKRAHLDFGHGHDPITFHTQATWHEVEEANPRYGVYVRSERERLGTNHPIYLTQYELQATKAAGRLLSEELIAKMRGEFPRLRAPRPGERYVAGCDLGGEGENADRTVATIGRLQPAGRLEVVEHISWQGGQFPAVVAGMVELSKVWAFERLCIDATGMGAPLVSQIAESARNVERFIFSDSSKSQLGYDLVAAAGTARVAFYADDNGEEAGRFIEELRACRSSLRGHSLLRWAAPAGAHDDYVASLALCLRAANSTPGPRVATGRSSR